VKSFKSARIKGFWESKVQATGGLLRQVFELVEDFIWHPTIFQLVKGHK
jgi:hypothetical protein